MNRKSYESSTLTLGTVINRVHDSPISCKNELAKVRENTYKTIQFEKFPFAVGFYIPSNKT